MVNYCIVCGRVEDGVRIHRFPRGGHRREWIAYAVGHGVDPARITASSKLCSRHFRDDDYRQAAVRRYLNPGSVPTIVSKI